VSKVQPAPPARHETADGMRIEWDCPIPMDDGVVLRADVFLPLEPGRYPVLISYGPYGKNLPMQFGFAGLWNQTAADDPTFGKRTSGKYVALEVPDPEEWVRDGYAIVRVDSRGAGRSPGVIDNYSTREAKDYYSCIEWAAAQPWSTGKIGTTGTSYYAVLQWLVARQRPPHLAAMYVAEANADWYRDTSRHGGILNEDRRHWTRVQIVPIQHGRGERGFRNQYTGMWVSGDQTLGEEELRARRIDVYDGAKSQPLATDDYYRDRTADLNAVTAPLLSVSSFGTQGLHLRGNVEGFVGAASQRKWLFIGAGAGYAYFHSDAGRRQQLRFFDRFLKDKGNWETERPVRLQLRRPGGTYTERTGDAWPLPETRWTRLYLDAQTKELTKEPAARASQISYRGLSDGITFRTRPYEAETVIAGPSAATLWISSSTTDADLFLVLRLFAPDGTEALFRGQGEPRAPLALGWLRASQRKLDAERSLPWRPFHSHDESQSLEPGRTYELAIEIWPTSIIIPAGYRLALTVRGKDFDHGLPPATFEFAAGPTYQMRGVGPFTHADPDDRPSSIFDGEVTIYTGADHQASLVVPIIP
jgi:uncharacterized protein